MDLDGLVARQNAAERRGWEGSLTRKTLENNAAEYSNPEDTSFHPEDCVLASCCYAAGHGGGGGGGLSVGPLSAPLPRLIQSFSPSLADDVAATFHRLLTSKWLPAAPGAPGALLAFRGLRVRVG